MIATISRLAAHGHRHRGGLQRALWAALLALAALPAQAANYTFPGNLPAGCSGTSGTYTCSALTLGYGDTVTIASPTPATINVSGAMSTNTSTINAGGSAGDLVLNVSGALTVGYQAVVNAQVTAASISDANGFVTFGGSVTASGGTIVLGTSTSVAGALTATGDITVGQQGVVGGKVTSSNGAVTVGYDARVTGAITARNNVTLAQNAIASSSIDTSTGNLDIGYAARVTGNATATLGTIALGQSAVASACVRASQPNTITLGYQASVTGVCCGGSCSNSCVTNNSTYSMPPACAAALVAEYRFEESSWNGTTSELRDTGGASSGPYHGKAQGSGLPTMGSASPPRSGDPGTCRYATLPGPTTGGGSFVVSGVPVSTTAGAKTTVSFWMYWDGSNSPVPVGWNNYVVELTSSYFGFNTANSDLYGTSSTSLPNGWHHVVAVFTNGSVTANKLYIDGTVRSLSQVIGSPNTAQAVVSSTLTIGGYSGGTGFRFSGRLDEVRVFNGELTATEVTTEYNRTEPCSTLVAQYRFEESAWNGTTGELKDSAAYASGPYDGKAQGSPLPSAATATPALTGNPGTCGYATLPGPSTGGGNFIVSGLPLTTVNGSQSTVAFWMYWDGTDARIAVGFNGYVIGLLSGGIGFNTNNSDLYGASSSGLANGWHHITAVFTNGSVTANRLYIDGTLQTLTQRTGSPLLSAAVVTTTLNIGGYSAANTYRFAGRIDEVTVYNGAISATGVAALVAARHACSTGLVAQWDFESITSNTTPDTTGNGNTLSLGASGVGQASGVFGSAMTLSGAFPASGASTTAAIDTKGSYTVAAWVKFTVMTSCMAQAVVSQDGVTTHAFEIVLIPGCGLTNPLFFEIMGTDSDASATKRVFSTMTPAANTWYHVAGVRDAAADTMSFYVNCALQGTASGIGTYASNGPLTVGRSRFSSSTRDHLQGAIDRVKVWNYAVPANQLTTECSGAAPIHHLEIQHASGDGLTCTPSTLTVRACQDAACTSLYTGGVTGTLTASGAGMTVNWPSTAAFTVAAGSSSTTETIHLTTAGSVLLSTTGVTPAPTQPTTCNFGSPSCTFTAADAGFLFDVPNHRAEVSNTVSVTAVKKSDNAASCVPAFASVSKPVNFKCAYVNPTTGTRAVRVGGAALNSGNSAGAACDTTGQSVTLAFNSAGVASTSVVYADAGAMSLTASYSGSGSDAGLVMTGSDTFIAAPYSFSVTGPAAGNIVAAANFSGSVTAKNYLGDPTPNFGRETVAEGVTLGWVRSQPQGSAAVNGSFTGSLGSFTNGVATNSTLKWSEVGRGELTAVLASGSYLGSGMTLAGATVGSPVPCSAEWGTCALPASATATVYYGGNGSVAVRSGMTGDVWCANGVFGDPLFGIGKNCWYVVTSGASSASTGAIGPFIPHHFDVTATPACSSFSYAGQPFAATVTARNANNATTVNYDGSANTSPNFAKLTTLVDAPVLGLGSWSNSSIAVGAFALGVANATPSYAFTAKTTAPQSLVVRATNTDAVSSLNFAEPTMPLRSGRIALSNAFGSEKAALAVPVQAQYWSGLAWVQNSADSCTSLPAAAVVRAAYRDGKGAASTSWTSSASAISISAGAGTLTLGAPSPTLTGSLDFALNLGSTTTDQSCLATHPASTGAGLTWLRSQNGACSTAWDRDPSARASFGIYTPETRKTIHVREIF